MAREVVGRSRSSEDHPTIAVFPDDFSFAEMGEHRPHRRAAHREHAGDVGFGRQPAAWFETALQMIEQRVGCLLEEVGSSCHEVFHRDARLYALPPEFSEKHLADGTPELTSPYECVLLIKRHLVAGRFRPEPTAAGKE